jgi:hypothetical protein
MSTLRSIEIDIDVHKRIEMERQGFDETPNDVLRRLLKLGEGAPPRPIGNGKTLPNGRPWSGKGVTLPHGTSVRMEYNGKGHSGQIDNGEWLVEGTRFNSPSAAAGGVARTRSGKTPSLDGWVYWHVKRPGDARWTPIQALRSKSIEDLA